MQRVTTILTDKQESLLGPSGITGMTAHRTGFAGGVGVYLDRHTPMQEGFIGNHAMQLSKGPFGMNRIGLSLLLARLFASLAAGSLTNISQVLQTNQGMGVVFHNLLTHDMIGVLRSPVSLARSSRQAAV